MSKSNQSRDIRRGQILDAAMHLARSNGFNSLTRDGIAEQANVATGQINWMYGGMVDLRDTVIKRTIYLLELNNAKRKKDTEDLLKILAAGLAAGLDSAKEAPTETKTKALQMLY